MNSSSISVIIPAYKAAGTIGRAIDSVLAQTLPAAEILVVDDGSPDDLAGAVARYGTRVTYIRKRNGRVASARNLGIDRSTGRFIAFLDADDYWEPTKLERQAEVFRRHPEVGLVAGNAFEQEPGRARALTPLCTPGRCDRVLRVGGPQAFDVATTVWTGTVVVRREVLAGSRFDTTLETAEDRDLWISLVTAAPVYLFSEPLATAVLEPDSLSRSDPNRDYPNMLQVVRRYSQLLGRSGTRLWEQRVFRQWAAGHLGRGNPAAAIRPAWQRLRRRLWSLEGWWVLLKAATLAGFSRATTTRTRSTQSTARSTHRG